MTSSDAASIRAKVMVECSQLSVLSYPVTVEAFTKTDAAPKPILIIYRAAVTLCTAWFDVQ
jgi:hypothetical protein